MQGQNYEVEVSWLALAEILIIGLTEGGRARRESERELRRVFGLLERYTQAERKRRAACAVCSRRAK